MAYEPEEIGAHFWTEEGPEGRSHLDVRELLSQGGEPYALIMECVSRLAAGQRLVVHAIMEPRPLLKQFERMGHAVAVNHAGPDHWEVEVTAG